MLRIVTEHHGDACTLSLHGRLADEWVGLVDRHWRSMLETIPAANVTVSLSDVSFVDTEGERLLEWMWRQGSRLEASGCRNRHVIETIRARREPPRTRGRRA
ncbi:MAG TPA: hypothetical protein VGK32_10285 [Vicinamibacterales bacterium]|jgi:ABC-type transporter Mla MlaB component